jgi:hypothetical protein
MKTVDLLRIAAKNLKGRWMILPALGMAISIFCLCFAGAVLVTVQQEKSKPYELAVSDSGNAGITDSTVAQIDKLPNVTAATALLQVSASVKTGIYSAQLTLTGIDPSYLNTSLSKGGVFPQSGDMPYIVLNAAAEKQFSKNQSMNSQAGGGVDAGSGNATSGGAKNQTDVGTDTGNANAGTGTDTDPDSAAGSDPGAQTNIGTDSGSAGTTADTGSENALGSDFGNQTGTSTQNDAGSDLNIDADSSSDVNADTEVESGDDTNAPKIDWLNVSYTLQTGASGQQIPVKVCGLIAGSDKGQEPAAYISLSAAKNLLQQSGQSTNYTGAKVRVKNIGYADSVSQAISELGLTVTNSNASLQSKWDNESKEMTYLIILGAFCLLCSSVLITVWRKISIQEQKRSWEALRWLGMKEKTIDVLFLIQAVIVSLIGTVVGIIVALSLPSFLPTALKGSSIYTLPIPFGVILISIVIFILPAMCTYFIKSKKYQDD